MASRSPQMVSSTPVIGFMDIDAFECQLWQRENPATRSLPCVVATHSERIVSVTHAAKALGINRKDTPTVKKAKNKCQNLHVFTKPDKYGKQDQSKCRLGTSQIVKAIENFLAKRDIKDVIVQVESSDEVYFDISAEVSRGMELKEKKQVAMARRRTNIPANIIWERERETKRGPFNYWHPNQPTTNNVGMAKDNKFYAYKNQERLMFGALFMNKLCTHVENQTGLKSSAGVAKNKLMAKVACSLNKPGKITVLGDEAFRRVSSLVNISSIPGLGGSMGQELMETFSIVKVSKIFGIPFDQLKDKFGNIAAQNIYSWAQGRDVDPVVAKVMKDKIKVNKPAGDVRTLLRLESILYNLILEVGEILQEEESRYFRTTDTIRLEFNLAGDKKGFSEDFRISDKDKFNKILKCIVPTAKLQFDTDNVVTSLALVLKNFEPRRNQNSPKLNLDLDTSMQNLSLGLPNTLKVDTKSPPTASDLTFRHSPVGFFRITKDLTFSMESKDALPRLMELEDLHSLVGYNLFKAFNPATRPTVITDYTYYDEIKHRCFSEWLRLEGPKFKGKVQFISFHGRILRSLKTIWNQTFGEWDTYAMNVNGTIYLWDEKTPRPRSQSFHYARQFMGCLFENLTTGKGKDGLPEDDIEKVFVIQKVQFGTHTLLLLNNVDAQDSSGNYVQVTLSADQTEFKNNNASLVLELNLKLWAQAVVSGAERLVIGTKNKKNLLTRVQLLETDEFRATLMKREEMAKCFNFQDRLLTFIKIHLPEHDRKLVKKFSWCPGKHNVAVSTVPEEEVDNLLIPKIYLK